MGVVYSTLHDSDEIRLLHLLPGSGSEPIKCTLVHARLGESPTYDALSYMWGAENFETSCALQVDDGRTLRVGENLGNALRYLRLQDEVRVLWVDAVCINQTDGAERGHQVAQMGRIYSQATTVRVWLGLPDDFTGRAFRFLSNADTVRNMMEGVVELSNWEAVGRLCEREYWDRLWIIQEIVLAARIDIHCGERVLPWDLFSHALFAFEKGLQTYGVSTRRALSYSAAMGICRQRAANTKSGPATELLSLMSLVWEHKGAKCIDVRDKIFGMHSFAPQCCRTANPVDYSCSAYELCRRVLEHDVLYHSNNRRNGGRERLVRRSLDLHGLIIGGALNQTRSKNHFEIGSPDLGETTSSPIPRPIIVLGHKIGRVVFVTPPLKSTFIQDEAFCVPRAMIRSFQELRFGCEDGESASLTTRITTALGKIWRNREMDIISGVGDAINLSMEMADLNSIQLQEDLAVHGLQTLLNFCAEFLRSSDFIIDKPGYEDCVMYLARGRLSWDIGFSPIGTKLGDSVCTFKDTDIVSIIRHIDGDHVVVGQGSRLEDLDAKSIAPNHLIGDVVNIQFDLSKLQLLSKISPRCELDDYRLLLTIPPLATDTNALHGRSTRTQGMVIPSYHEAQSPRFSADDRNPPKYSDATLHYTSLELRRRVSKNGAAKYGCPRCNATFATSRDNVLHAATWLHEKCRGCERWISYEPSLSTSTIASFCLQCCRNESSFDYDLRSPVNEEPRFSWWRTNSASLSTENIARVSMISDETVLSSFRDSIAPSEAMSSNATTISDTESIRSDKTSSTATIRPRSHSSARRDSCGDCWDVLPDNSAGEPG